MDVSSLKGRLPFEILESLAARGISELTPPQSLAVGDGLLEGKNLVISAPTASGKTLIAEMAAVRSILAERRKAIYIAPMRALVSEKFNEFRSAYPFIKSAISIGDLDSDDKWLSDYDMIFVSTEKFDSLLRHGINWLQAIGCIIVDEVHMLGEQSRGPTLELLITKLKETCGAQIIALSATIGNSREIAQWLKAGLVVSDFRPVKLVKGAVHNGVAFVEGSDGKHARFVLDGESQLDEIRIVEDTLLKGKQILIFYSTRKNAEAGATRIAKHIDSSISDTDRLGLSNVSKFLGNVLEVPTEQCVKLSGLAKSGVAFHHAGLLNQQRSAIEDAFRNNLVKVVCSTTTLGLGVNMPAHTVLVRNTSRYGDGYSSSIGVNEVMQLFGRAGRPKYDKEGRAFLLASSEAEVKRLFKEYIEAGADDIDSQLGIAPVLRTHILAFIAEGFLSDRNAIVDFLSKSFYGHQYRNMGYIGRLVDGILGELFEWGFVEHIGGGDVREGVFKPTRIGKRVSELYIDPLSAKWMLDSMQERLDDIGMLYMISNTLEMAPHVKPTEEAERAVSQYFYNHANSLILKEFERGVYGTYEPERAFATALMLNDWMEEIRERDLIKRYSTTPGGLYTKLTTADWMIYSAIELAKLIKAQTHRLIDIRVRLRYGIKDELLDLVRVEQIGRVRARMLYANGIRSVSDMRNNKDKVRAVLGKEIAERVLGSISA
ncbi:MAG: DEAD/DEAH box helicase [Candidatus Micrarchaeota archaeon]|nr:DEAD/DEAH box helicase [Candidatus Micrarchaeota archaeon]